MDSKAYLKSLSSMLRQAHIELPIDLEPNFKLLLSQHLQDLLSLLDAGLCPKSGFDQMVAFQASSRFCVGDMNQSSCKPIAFRYSEGATALEIDPCCRLANLWDHFPCGDYDAEVFFCPELIPEETCQSLAVRARQLLQPSLVGGEESPLVRNSETAFLEGAASDEQRQIESILNDCLQPPETAIMEPMAINHYQNGQYYREHTDGCGRAVSVLVFLESPASGGHTQFPAIGAAFRPQVGTVLAWRNAAWDPDFGYWLDNTWLRHESCPVFGGCKTSGNLWFSIPAPS